MALNILTANEQVKQLSQQSAAIAHAVRTISIYKEQLCSSWSGEEINYINNVLNDLIRKCEKIQKETEAISCDMVKAIEEISAEEAANI